MSIVSEIKIATNARVCNLPWSTNLKSLKQGVIALKR